MYLINHVKVETLSTGRIISLRYATLRPVECCSIPPAVFAGDLADWLSGLCGLRQTHQFNLSQI